MKKTLSRSSQIKKARININKNSYPRLEMLLLVLITGFAGFLTSYGLLGKGVNTVWLRYLISMGVAYIVFLGLLGVWLSFKTTKTSVNMESVDDLADAYMISGNSSSKVVSSQDVDFHSDVGDFSSEGEVIGEAFGAAAQAEEAAIPLMLILALIIALFSIFIVTFSLVASAPILFSELLVDGMLSASLYHRLRGIDSKHWLESAIKRTVLPFLLATLTFVAIGLSIGYFMPQAHSLGDVLRMF
jgi:hypothetical protein